MFAVQCWNGMGRRHHSSRIRTDTGDHSVATFAVISQEISLGPLARYGTHQETIGERPEQVYLPSDPSLEWSGSIIRARLK